MPDLSIETRNVCYWYYEWLQYGRFSGEKEPECNWNEEYSDESVKEVDGEKVCPCCDGPVEVIRVGV